MTFFQKDRGQFFAKKLMYASRITFVLGPILILSAPVANANDSRFSERLYLVEAASWQPNGVLRLVPSLPSTKGAAWSSRRIPIARPFTVEMDFRISANGGYAVDKGGDGLAIVLQGVEEQKNEQKQTNLVSRNIGIENGGIGYYGLERSLAIEFDTWQNTPYGDINNNHVALHTNEGAANRPESRWQGRDVRIAESTRIPNLKASSKVSIRVFVERVEGRILVYVWKENSKKPLTPVLEVPDDYLYAFGTSHLRVGITAATGGSWSNHDVLAFRVTENP